MSNFETIVQDWAVDTGRIMAEEQVNTIPARHTTALHRSFVNEWFRWKIDGQSVPLPADWIEAVTKMAWKDTENETVSYAVDIAMQRVGVQPDRRFAYFCGVVRNINRSKNAPQPTKERK